MFIHFDVDQTFFASCRTICPYTQMNEVTSDTETPESSPRRRPHLGLDAERLERLVEAYNESEVRRSQSDGLSARSDCTDREEVSDGREGSRNTMTELARRPSKFQPELLEAQLANIYSLAWAQVDDTGFLEAARAFTASIQLTRCNRQAAQLLGLRLHEILLIMGTLFRFNSLSRLSQALRDAHEYMQSLCRPGFLSILLSGRRVRERFEGLDFNMVVATVDLVETISQETGEHYKVALTARSFPMVVNAQATVAELGSLNDILIDEEKQNALARALQSDVTDLVAEVKHAFVI